MEGKTINGYTLKKRLGVGGMAEVWYAENSLGKCAAVKLLLPRFCNDESIVARFQNEAKVMVQLDHPNIRQVYDFGYIDERPCILMEYLEGDDLKALMKSGRRFTKNELIKWWNEIADALAYTHKKDIVHRDIKPSNIFLDKKGNIKLLDFGIAKIKESISMTQTGTMMGTLLYMSPEQVTDSKHIGPKSDIYSLAVTFVHLLSGKAPYDTTTSNDYEIRKGIVEIPLDLSEIPTEWQGFLKPYLAKKADERPNLRPFEVVKTNAEETIAQPAFSDESTVIDVVQQPKNEQPKKQEQPQNSNIQILDLLKEVFVVSFKKNWKKHLILLLALAVVFYMIDWGLGWEFKSFDYDMPIADIILTFIPYILWCELFAWIVKLMDKLIKNFSWIITIITSVVFFIGLFLIK